MSSVASCVEQLTVPASAPGLRQWYRFEPALEREFLRQMRDEQRRSALICTLTALAIWLAFIGLDAARLNWIQELTSGKSDAAVFVLLRIGTTAVLMATVWALATGRSHYPVFTFTSVVALAISASICMVIYRLRGIPSAAMAEFAILIAVFLPLGLTFLNAVIAALIVAIAHAVTGSVLLPSAQILDHLRLAAMLMFTGLIGSVGAALRERSHREQFLLRRLLHQQANTDALTGVGNRRWFEEAANAAMAEARLLNQPFCLAVVDVDEFKLFNDRYGHQAGDRALQEIAQAMKARWNGPEIILARMGGEEFAIAASGLVPEAFEQRLHRLMVDVAERNIAHASSTVAPHLTVSIGAAMAKPEDDMDRLYRRADALLYRAKDNGRRRVIVSSDMTRINDTSGDAPSVAGLQSPDKAELRLAAGKEAA